MNSREPALEQLAELIKKAQHGDRQAMGQLIQGFQDALFKFCLYLSGNRQTSQDICQDTFIKALENLHKIKNPEAFKAWIFTMAKNLYLDQVRSKYSKARPLDEDFDQSDEHQGQDQTETLLELKRALVKLEAEDRLVIVLIEIEGYSYLEAAKIVGISENAMRSRLFRARKDFMEKMQAARNEFAESSVYRKEAK